MTPNNDTNTDIDQLAILVEQWHDHADYLFKANNPRIQGMARGYRSCAEDLERYVDVGDA